MEYVLCTDCSFPILANDIGQDVTCPSCHQKGTVMLSKEVDMRSKVSTNQVSTKISGPGSGFLEFMAGLVIGVVFAPAIIASTKAGAEYLEKLAKEKIKR